MSGRPEHQAPPEIFYGEDEARKYTRNTRMMEIQLVMSERAVELLCLPENQPCHIIDLGCGSGLSGETLTEQGHVWTGVDISSAMLGVAKEREVEGDLILGDLGQGLPFRAGAFDGAISISALQWLCNADQKSHNPAKRLYIFFSSLYSCLSRGSRAVFQFYPENSSQVELITSQAMKAGFTGGLVVDYPNSTKAKKFFLCLMTGGQQPLPAALGVDSREDAPNCVAFSQKRDRIKQLRAGKAPKKSRDWILEKKERRRRQGKETREDSKFTGRKRQSHVW
uniref:18S rRNA (guanine-N(7))-methyltransferase n=1 Tax=Daphnia sinensis TaxID=1820382 RepID=A0A4Y7NDK5_9CRUS|nr:EOG090X0BBW [Daphnia sinensis]SVE90707.1 EOG090X0BBW [Daphnia sinensis]SVE91334.1 EOG090X0BBW [Daphnia sinensis]SVE91957.1 EOG090X0BBW [Daphnia sinensis]